MTGLKLTATKEEMDLIFAICERAERLDIAVDSRTSHVMDLCATHSNGCALDFRRLLEASDGNFAHDFVGIRRHINRETGQLMDCFLPRCARFETGAA